ncbi:hypothetical protein LguiA_001290 [Lonicera macranthoides]
MSLSLCSKFSSKMASNLSICPPPTELTSLFTLHTQKYPLNFTLKLLSINPSRGRRRSFTVRASNGGNDDSYLDMWKQAVDRERKAALFQKIADNTTGDSDDGDGEENPEVLERKTTEFEKLLQVSPEERDRVQRMQVVDRAAAAIAAARALLKESLPPPTTEEDPGDAGSENFVGKEDEGTQNASIFVSSSGNSSKGAPGPSFWSWTPPPDTNNDSNDKNIPNPARNTSPSPIQTNPVMELDRSIDFLPIPLESKLESTHDPPLPPLQSLMEVKKMEIPYSILETPQSEEKHELDIQFSTHAQNAARALGKVDKEVSFQGISADGLRWWKETGTELRPDGVVCRWTLTRGVSADEAVEWEEKYWEAADEFEFKELGSEKSGRDSSGNVWSEYWKESMYQKHGSLHMEKTADKWGKNGKGDEWQEQWWEGYGASGQAEKWAHKWCSIDPNTQLDAGHAHVWHERWGEQYDGQGGSTKYTDKWAERSEGDGWSKWGDKWDEHFDPNGHGVKQGETWWEGKYGERWNRTWGEGHNGSGWVHKYGKSSSGEHWDTHEEQDTWYERYPHFGFYHCFENSVQLREVKKPSESSEDV